MQDFTPDSPLVCEVRPSPNQDERMFTPDVLLLHYTGMASTAAAIERLCDPAAKVSAHYVVEESGTIIQLVAEERRAWHAGHSSWEGVSDINSRSIGIEIGNRGHDYDYPDFPEPQIATVIALSRDIITRHRLRADRVLAHSDVAPLRKRDPGEKFPWQRLHDAGVGAWVEPAPIRPGLVLGPRDARPEVVDLQIALQVYGYGIVATGIYDELTTRVVTAFQRHFRPACVDGRADLSTIETLQSLLAASDRWRSPLAGD